MGIKERNVTKYPGSTPCQSELSKNVAAALKTGIIYIPKIFLSNEDKNKRYPNVRGKDFKARSHGAIFSECDCIFTSNRSLTV